MKEASNKEKQAFKNMFAEPLYAEKAEVKKEINTYEDPSNPLVFMDVQIGD